MLGAVEDPGQHLLERIGLLLIRGDDPGDLLGRKTRLAGLGDAEELRIVGGHPLHVLADAVEHALFGVVDVAEEAGLPVVCLHPARGLGAELPLRLDDLSGPLQIEAALGAHAPDDAGAADGDVAVLVREEHRGADPVVPAAGRIGAVDPHQDGDAQLVEPGVAVEGGAAAASIRIDLLLLGELHPRAVEDPDERHAKALGQFGDAKDVLRLTPDPGPREHLVVGRDHHGPAAAHPGQAVDHPGGALVVPPRVVDGVERMPGPLVDQVVDALPGGELAALVDLLGGKAGGPDPLHLGGQALLHLLDQGQVLLRAAQLALLERPAELGHLLEIRPHGGSSTRWRPPAGDARESGGLLLEDRQDGVGLDRLSHLDTEALQGSVDGSNHR